MILLAFFEDVLIRLYRSGCNVGSPPVKVTLEKLFFSIILLNFEIDNIFFAVPTASEMHIRHFKLQDLVISKQHSQGYLSKYLSIWLSVKLGPGM